MRSRVFGSNLLLGIGILLAASIFLCPSQAGWAATYNWDPGTSGTWIWDTTTYLNWYNSGTNTDILWPNLSTSVADFGAGNLNGAITGGVVTVASGGVQANGITFDLTGYTISGAPITLSGTTPTITLASGNTDTINSNIGGSAGMIKTGASSTLILNGANTYTGVTDIQSGYVTIGNDNAFGAAGAGNGIVVESGGGIYNWLTRTIVDKALTLNGSGDGANMAMRVGGNQRLTWTGAVALGSDSTIRADGGAGFTFTKNIDGSTANSGAGASFTINSDPGATSFVQGNLTLGGGQLVLGGGGGTLTLSGAANAWTGGITINTGTLQIGDGGANGSLPDPVGGFISLNATGSTLAFNSANDFTIANTMIAGSGNITKNGLGTLTLSGTNYYTGTTNVNAGILKITNAYALGSSSNVAIAGGTATGILQLNGSGGDFTEYNRLTLIGRSAATTAHVENFAGNNILADPSTGLGNISLIEGGNQYVIQSDPGAGNFLTITGTIQNNAALTGPRNLNLVGGGNGLVSGVIGGGTGSGDINVVKNGTGTWTLSAANTYAGTTTVTGGTLALSSTGSIASSSVITVNSPAIFNVSAAGIALSPGQTLGGTGTVIGNVADTSSGGAIIAPGGAGIAGTLTFSPGYSLGLINGPSNTLKFELGLNTSTTSDSIVVDTFDARNSNKLNIDISPLLSSLANGTYPLIKYSTYRTNNGSIANDFNLISYTRQTYTLVNNTGSKEIDVQVSGQLPLDLTWVGTQNGNTWDIGSTHNWTDGSASQMFYDSDRVTFTSSGSNSPDINMIGRLVPGNVNFTNSQDYKFIGSGYISGNTGLTLNGSGKVTLANSTANDFTGPIAVNSGTLQLGDGSTNGVIASAASITDNSALIINPVSDVTVANAISGTGTLTKLGPGALTLSSSNSYTGATTISVGKVIMGNAYAFGPASNANTVTVSDGATLDLNSLNAGVSASRVLNVQGTGYDGNGAVVSNGTADMFTSFHGVNFTGDTTLGGNVRWDIGRSTGAYLAGNGFTLTKTGTNRIILVDLSYTNLGAIVVNNGDLCLQGTSIAGSSTVLAPITVNYGATQSVWGIAAAVANPILVNGGTVGTTLTDAGAATFSGPITMTSLGGTLTNTGTSGNVTFSGIISDDISTDHAMLTKTGSSTVVLTNTANSWSGGTTINLGALQIGDGGANGSLPDIAGTIITNNGTLTFNSNINFTIANAQITGPGILTKTGSGALTLSGFNSYTGVTNVNGGILKINNSYSLGTSSNVAIAGGGATSILQLDGSAGDFSQYNLITLAGRAAANVPHIQNLSGNNFLADPSIGYGNISLVEGGNQYVIQSDAGLLTISGTIQNNAGAGFTSARNVYFQGAGNGVVSGVIGGGSNTGAINIVKTGSGTWTLSAYNTYTGTTTVNAGILALGAGASINSTTGVTVNSAAILDVSATSGLMLGSNVSVSGVGTVKGNVADSSSGGVTLVPGALLTPGTLTFTSGALGLTNGANDVIKFDIGQTPAASSDLIVADTFNASNPNKINIGFNLLQSGINNGTYPLIKFNTYIGSSTISDNISFSGLPTGRQTYNLQKNGSEIDLVVNGAAMNLTWVGTQNGNTWDINTTSNWSNGASQTFFDGDTVNFTDSGSNSPNINLAAKLSPGSVTFNSTKNYTLTGPGYISGGSTTLTVGGGGKLTLANSVANDFGGAITINSGTLQIGDGANNSGIASTVPITDNGALIIDPATSVTMANVISGTGTLTKLGTGVLTLSASNAYTGATTISAGKVILGNAYALGPAANTSTITINNGGTLDLNNTYLGVASRILYVQGAGYDGNGAVVSNAATGGQQNSFLGVNLTGDTTFGGSIRWDIRATSAYLAGNGYALTKTGVNTVYLVSLGSTNISSVTINNGTLGIQDTTVMSTPSALAPITVTGGGTLATWALTAPVANSISLNNGTISVGNGVTTFSGPIAIGAGGGALSAAANTTYSGQIGGSGLLTKTGGSTVFLTNTSNNWTGGTTVSGGTLSVGNLSGTGANGYLPDTTGTISIASGTNLTFNTAIDETFTNAQLGGPGTLNQIGADTVTFSGNTVAGYAWAINAGTGTGNTAGGRAGALRITNPAILNNATSITFGGGISGTRLELATTGTPAAITKAMTINGRYTVPMQICQPDIVNVSGNNTISGTITITTGGAQYFIQTNAGAGNSLTLGAITEGSTSRILNFMGGGIGSVTGVIGGNVSLFWAEPWP
jgi:fibronectin-binding autotransporter adhesin